MRQLVHVLLLVGIALVLVYGTPFVTKRLPDLTTSVLKPRDSTIGTIMEDASRLPLTVPAGFSIHVFADDLDGPRVMTRDPNGDLVVSLTRAGKIVVLPDRNGNGVADENIIVLEGLDRPHGAVFRCQEAGVPSTRSCLLYVAEEGAVSEYQYNSDTKIASARRNVIDLPTRGGGHFTRTLLWEPGTDRLLVSVGSSCNVCIEDDSRRASILAVTVEDATSGVYARGLRNAVFMAIHPVTGLIWASENGRDNLGDDLPPDEINIVNEGGNYGWPICFGDNVHDTSFDKNVYIRDPCMEPFETPSWIDLPAHSAALGLDFVPEEGWPESLWFDLIVAYHGSWNRTEKTGYKLVRLRLDEQGMLEGMEDFVTGWLAPDGKVLGRPVDVRIEPGGIMYVTDDYAGVVYRITYQSR